MSTPATKPPHALAAALPDRAARRRIRALGRAELTLLFRYRLGLFTALLMPLVMVIAAFGIAETSGLEDAALPLGALVMTGGVGMVLLMVVYAGLTATYVTRREERVLKRLRTGEPTDAEILAGTALPAIGVALGQIAVLMVSGALLFEPLGMPRRPDLLLAGVLLGLPMMVTMAALTSVVTRTAESAQLTTMPLFMVSLLASGLVYPLTALPDAAANVCRLLPLTPVIDLFRAGWLGTDGVAGFQALPTLAVAVAWTAAAVFGVRRHFRWDPRG